MRTPWQLRRSVHRRGATIWGPVLLFVVTACGSLESREDIIAAAGGATSESNSQAGSGVAVGEEGLAVVDGTADATVEGTAGTDSAADDPAAAAGAGPDGQPAAAGDLTADGSKATPGTKTLGVRNSDRSTITIGNVSTMSGISGGAQKPGVVGLQAWVKFVNAKGGVNGHPIRLITRDDQSDPNQNAAATQALVEQSKVVAFVANWATQTQQASANYLKSKGIPVVGGDHNAQESWGKNPMFFPSSAIGPDAIRNTVHGLARTAVPQGKKKLGILVCAEAAICSTGAQVGAEHGPKVGFQVVYNASASFAAPGYTAECINMRNSGVEAVLIVFPASATRNVGRDCDRQGVEAIYALAQGTMEGDFNKDPVWEGSSVSTPTFTFSGLITPFAKEYETALAKYAPDQVNNPVAASGWVSGVAFGHAVAQIDGPVTSAKLLDALYTFKDETLGGRAIPLTYRKAPMVPKRCYFHAIIRAGKYVPQNEGKHICQ